MGYEQNNQRGATSAGPAQSLYFLPYAWYYYYPIVGDGVDLPTARSRSNTSVLRSPRAALAAADGRGRHR
ncbi:hypothetical protein E2562_022390 [Oryza meyeriana var. granulata]|uniref:Uncharacterized protein n=1 Tax=Oryza meyeriana var. granulata TaxID=110450 RepID=A0A6G1EY49_9ORYZ|nr:hypothetical protein E2562_022390 [Oryza meyeriana var. granulata]